MLTDNKEITKPEYWNKVYAGENNNAKVDASNFTRPVNTFDRFAWVAQQAEGPNVLGIGSGHAHVEKRIKAKWPKWNVVASDQTIAAMRVAKFQPYEIINGYSIPFPDKSFQTLIVTQALEYFEFQDKFLLEVKRVANKFLCSIPIGNMEKWSQLIVYEEKTFLEWLTKYGEIEFSQRHDDLLMVKLKFNV